MSTSIVNSFTKLSSRLMLTGALLAAGAAAAAEPQSDPQSMAQQLLSPVRVAASDHAGNSAALPDPQEQARRLLTGTTRTFNPSGVRVESPAHELRSSRSVEARDLARRMILGREA
jgi:hypothetical protein